MKEKKPLNTRVPIELWNAVDDAWMRARKENRTLSKEEFLEGILKSGLKIEERRVYFLRLEEK